MGFFTGEEIKPVTSPHLDPAMTNAFTGWLRGMLAGTGDGGFSLGGAQMYNPYSQDAINASERRVPINQNLQSSWDAWSPNGNAGNNWLTQYLSGGSGPDAGISGRLQQQANSGNLGGDPGAMLMAMSQYGGAGQRGLPAMGAALEYGAPSQAGQYVASQAQFGVSSEGAGRPLANRAYGQPTAAASYLAPFIQRMGGGYKAPTIQRRTPTQQGAI